MEVLQHFSHEHPLVLYESLEEGDGDGDGDEKVICYGCLQPLSGAIYYNCIQCQFNIHKSCAELPNKIIHFMHPKHPLTLLRESPYKGDCICDECDELIWGFVYNCSLCKFDIDIKCALLQPIVEYEDHKHSFVLFRPLTFTCDACGKTDNGKSYLCTTCQFLIHKNCSISLSQTTVQELDRHDCGISSIHHKENTPTICEESNQELDPTPNISKSNEGIADDVKEEADFVEIRRAIELDHFSHQHCLILCEDEPRNEEICDACVRLISSPFYKCDQCNFFLHMSCAELPDTMLHPFHPHPLTLLQTYHNIFSVLRCYACERRSNGLTYSCDKCQFYLDARCASLSDTLQHEGHQHTLNLVQKQTLSKCSACDMDCTTKFRCEECDFNLDLRCASLPYSTRHECHRHKWEIRPFPLTYGSVEDESGEYYCDICEDQRGQNHWFYHCVDCDYSAHPKCILGDYLIKVGKTYKKGIWEKLF